MNTNNTNQNELKIRIKSELIGIRNGLIVETHSLFPPGERSDTVDYGIKSMANNINCTISPFSLLGWLRHGITEYLISEGISVCHNYDLTNVSKSNQDYVSMGELDLQHGYHKKRMSKGDHKEKPECEAEKGEMCLVGRMFGGFTGHHRVFSLMPVKVSPVQGHYDKGLKNITGKGNYRNIAISPRSNVDGAPFATHTSDVVANVDAIMYLRMYENNPLYVALVMRGIEYLNEHRFEYGHQLGGGRTFGSGFIESIFLPPELTKVETTKYHNLLIKKEDDAIDGEGLTKAASDKISAWEDKKKELNTLLDEELVRQRELFGIEKKWWSQKI